MQGGRENGAVGARAPGPGPSPRCPAYLGTTPTSPVGPGLER